jgi:hypothetical protein
LLSLGFGCTGDDESPMLEVDVAIESAQPPMTPDLELAKLRSITGDKGKLADAVIDVHHMLTAQNFERQENWEKATKSWFAALAVSRGRFGNVALDGWVSSYAKNLGKKTDRSILAKLLLAETRNGRHSPYMMNKKITNEAAMLRIVQLNAKEWLLEETPKPNPDYDAPSKSGIQSDDLLLTKGAKSFCKSNSDQQKAWLKWSNSLEPPVREYWVGLTEQCRGAARKAMEALTNAYLKLSQRAATRHLAISAGEALALLTRRNGQRTTAADVYKNLMDIWAKGDINSSQFGRDPAEYHRRKVNDALWAARYRGLIGDYESAKSYAQLGLDNIAKAYNAKVYRPTSFRKELAELKAEGYHILAYRIAVEKREYESAQSLTLLALQIPNLSDDWQDRLKWLAGVYDYLGGHYEGAKRRWEQMLVDSKNETLRPMLYFWLAKAHDRMNHTAESEFFLEAVADDYPLSFYSVVAPKTAGLKGAKDWREVFGDLDDLVEKLKEGRDYNLQLLRRNEGMRRLLLRSEILVAAGLKEWSHMAVKELDREMTKRYILASHPTEFIYLSRLHYNAGNYLDAISITTKLSRAVQRFWKTYPEQLLIYFPKPFQEIYQREANSNNIEEELLMAISRQESGFTPRIRSHAGAIGMMQLIKPTARRFASELGIPEDQLVEALNAPSTNIAMGSRYLKNLSLYYKGYKPGIYGGYNAGEYAVDAWIKRRGHSDPLLFVELVPFGETKGYIKNVWRNALVYHYIRRTKPQTRQLVPTIMGDRQPAVDTGFPSEPSPNRRIHENPTIE